MLEDPGGGCFRVGTSGHHYELWRGVFYPESLSSENWFDHHARSFDTVEINNTFYRPPEGDTFVVWRERAPHGFLYALKFSRYGSHLKHLKEPADAIDNFLQAAGRLEDGLGSILVRLPPRWAADPGQLEGFLEAAPEDLRWAVEVRDPSWLGEAVYAVLRRAGAALCIHDMIEDHPREITANLDLSLRYYGDRYVGSYSHQKLTAGAERITGRLANGTDVFAYLNKDQGGAVFNARDLGRYVASRCGAEGPGSSAVAGTGIGEKGTEGGT